MMGFAQRAFRRAERTVAGPIERFVESDAAIDAILRLTGVQGDIQRQMGRVLDAYLHLWQLPSLRDVRRLSQQLAQVERRVRELSREGAQPPGESDGRSR